MIESARKALQYVQGMNFEEFTRDSKTRDAVVRNLEILGEAARRIPQEVQQRRPEIPWAQIVGMRNRLIHGYFAIDPRIVWEIVHKELPPLFENLQKVQKEAEDEGSED